MEYSITINGIERKYPEGTTYLDISKEYENLYNYDIVLAVMNKRLRELNKKVEGGGELCFITAAEQIGRLTITRGLILMMLRAVYRVCDRNEIKKVKVEYSIGDGLFCIIDGDVNVDEEMVLKVKEEMKSLNERNLPFVKRSIDTADAVSLFHEYKMYDKEKLFSYRRVSKTNIYNLDGFEDYFYGYMPPSTGMLTCFDLICHEPGFFLQLPTAKNPKALSKFEVKPKLFNAQLEASRLLRLKGIETVGALNDKICNGSINELILEQEALQEKKIAGIAEQIKSAGNKKFIMIAGPSSSGKTTFSHRLSIQLRTLCYVPHPIAVDDYFLDRDKTPRDEYGNYNFEILDAIDVEQFNKDMTALLNGEKVELPSFNFKTGRREYKGNVKRLGADDILIIEGIHGLNDRLSYSLPKESKFKIYISALTQLNIDEHNRIPTTDGRLIRRMVRDARTRGALPQLTISMWPSVRRGEEENIFPFQEECDCMFNSALTYELAVLKQYAEPLLFSIKSSEPEYHEAKRLLKFLDYFLGVSSEEIPKNSIIREFVGGSCFRC